ncbi:phosphodiester glycosidase family protein [Chitinophaga defluvii]|uniref:Phosphodiester glycosidase family protein n=1 Tax=Chitinophaga defluvii TaxID=3163343 RepID=A0ABV2TD55_9BACT
MKRILLILGLTGLVAEATAQLHWRESADHNNHLPASVRVFETKDTLDGKPFQAFYLIADLKDKQLDFVTRTGDGKRFTPAQYAAKEGDNTLAVVNTTFFSFKDNSNLNLVISDGKVKAVNPKMIVNPTTAGKADTIYPTTGAFGISRQRQADIAWVYNVGRKDKPFAYSAPAAPITTPDGQVQYNRPSRKYPSGGHRWRMRQAVGGGPILVQDGKVFITSKEEHKFGYAEQDMHPRTAIGYTKDHKLILLAVEGRHKGIADGASLPQLADIMISLGCVEALNLDGGGSSCLYVAGKNTIYPSDKGAQRPVPAVLVIKKR